MQTRLATANCDETRTLFFLFVALTSASVAENSRRNFLSPSDVFARTRENHVKSRFKAVIYVNETLTTSTKFYGPELTLRLAPPPQVHTVFSFRSSSLSRLSIIRRRTPKRRKEERRRNVRRGKTGERRRMALAKVSSAINTVQEMTTLWNSPLWFTTVFLESLTKTKLRLSP